MYVNACTCICVCYICIYIRTHTYVYIYTYIYICMSYTCVRNDTMTITILGIPRAVLAVGCKLSGTCPFRCLPFEKLDRQTKILKLRSLAPKAPNRASHPGLPMRSRPHKMLAFLPSSREKEGPQASVGSKEVSQNPTPQPRGPKPPTPYVGCAVRHLAFLSCSSSEWFTNLFRADQSLLPGSCSIGNQLPSAPEPSKGCYFWGPGDPDLPVVPVQLHGAKEAGKL